MGLGHRQQWIDAHIKGPDQLPLVIKPTIIQIGR